MERKVVKADGPSSLDPRSIWRNLLPGRPRVDFLSVERACLPATNDARVGTNFTETCYATGDGDGFTTAVASSVCTWTHHPPLLLLRFVPWHQSCPLFTSSSLRLIFLSPSLLSLLKFSWISSFFVLILFFPFLNKYSKFSLQAASTRTFTVLNHRIVRNVFWQG